MSAVALLVCSIVRAESFRTRATGRGGAAPGQGLVSVTVTVDDPTGRVDSTELFIQTTCAFASDTERPIEFSQRFVFDLDHDRSCKVVRSFLCVTMSEGTAKSSGITFDGAQKAKLEAAGPLVVIDLKVAMRITAWTGMPRMGVRETGLVSGNFEDGFRVQGGKWSAVTTAREVCLPDGISRFFQMHDPALDGR